MMTLKSLSKILREIQPSDLSDFLIEDWEALFTNLYHRRDSLEPGQYFGDMAIDELIPLFDQIPNSLKDFLNDKPFESEEPLFTFIDLFAGIGGFNLSLSSAGGRALFSSEWDNAAKQTYFNNYKEVPFGDITRFTTESVSDDELDLLIPDHDVLAAGFPCQPFSRAGVSARTALNMKHGFECNTQGTLFHDVIRIARVKRPKVLFLENVKNLKSHDGGNTFKVIETSIRNLGYTFNYAIINAKTLVPQKRVRCYMVATREDIPEFNFDLTPFEGDELALRDILEPEEVTLEYQISQKLWDGHVKRTERNLERGTGFTALQANIDEPANTLVARYGKDGKECLIPVAEGQPPRKLTKREAARLQGFPEHFVLPEAKTPTYKQMGNSVAVPVVSELSNQIIRHLEGNHAI